MTAPRTGSPRAAPRRVSLGLLLLVLLPATAAATWYESYDSALSEIEAENWVEAVRLLNESLEEQPQSSAQARTYGMRFIPYFPYLKLGIAYYHLGQPDAAMQAFETEERQGAVTDSDEARREMESWRDRISREQDAAAREIESRTVDIVSDGLAEAARLENDGRFEDALAAVDRVLSVSTDHPDALAARLRLRQAIAAEVAAREAARRFDRHVREGRAELAAGRNRAAATSFSQALEVRQDSAVEGLLEQARNALRVEAQALSDDTARQQQVTRGIARAQQLEAAGEFGDALDELMAVFAIDPKNRAARSLERRLLSRRLTEEQTEDRARTIRGLLDEAVTLLDSGDPEAALRKANRVLSLDATHTDALAVLAGSYAAVGERLLGAGNRPPVIAFESEGILRTDTATIVLTGRVYDDTSGATISADGFVVDMDAPERLAELWVTDFRLHGEVAPGTTAMTLVALDRDGATTRADREIVYRVPLIRRTGFLVTVGLLLLTAAAILGAKRLLSRKRLRERRFNPYIAGAPILDADRYYGRQRLLDYVLQRIHNNSVLLYGERRIGKTSFQHQLKRRLHELDDPEYEFLPVYIDLQGTPEETFFQTLAHEIFSELAPQLGDLEMSEPRGGENYGHRELVRDLQKVIRVLRESSTRKIKLVLQIDEVDELNEYDPRVNQKLRSLFMRSFADSLVSVVSGVAIAKHWEREGSPWYNFFQEIEIEPLEPDEAESLVRMPIRQLFRYEDGVAEEILSRTSRKPYLIQRLCSVLVERMHEEGRRTVTRDDVEVAFRAEGL